MYIVNQEIVTRFVRSCKIMKRMGGSKGVFVRSYRIIKEMKASVILKQKGKEGVLTCIRGVLEETVETEKIEEGN